ncbi:Phosphate transport system permease protein PstA [Rhabdaerophilaceae bacterium]
MTDQTLPIAGPRSFNHESDAARLRLKQRYASEARFRALGLGAIVLTALFLGFLLVDILRKGLPAFFEHRALLSVTLDASAIDPRGQRDLAELRNGDYQAVLRAGLQDVFPGSLDRRARRALDGILSTGAVDDLRNAVLANPGIVGQTRTMPLLLSADADLYLRHRSGTLVERRGDVALALAGSGDQVTIKGQSANFRTALAETKTFLAQRQRKLEAERATLSAGASAAADAKRAELASEIAALQSRVSNSSASEVLSVNEPSLLVSINGGIIKLTELGQAEAKGTTLVTPKSMESSGNWALLRLETPEGNRRVSDQVTAWLETLRSSGKVENGFAWRFFTNGDSREPELAGIRGALIGSALTLLVTLLLCVPIGVGAAVYLEEFAPKNWLTDILEVNINNLAAVPSIVFGLLGLAMFINTFNLPRSAPLVGGLVLALLVLPTIIIASRAALKAVPPSIKEAALGVGASHQQAVFQHVLPLAMPGIMTGTIIGMAHALGETAPLLMIGMVAFIVDIPQSLTEAATVMPVQIFLWADLPELAFQSRTAAAIIVLLCFLLVMNAAAVILRKMFERRW